jgi:hypothetical protein
MAVIPALPANLSDNDAIQWLINQLNTQAGGANSSSGLPIAQGGTGAVTAAAALTALGAVGAGGAASFTTLAASSTVSGTGFTNYMASPPSIGGTAPPAAITANVLTASNAVGQGTVAVNSQVASGFGGFIKIQSGGTNQAYIGSDAGINGGTNYAQLTLQTVSGNINLQPTGGNVIVSTGVTVGSTTLLTTSVALTNGAAANAGTLTNAPAVGNPTKWIPINDNGTTRYIPAW